MHVLTKAIAVRVMRVPRHLMTQGGTCFPDHHAGFYLLACRELIVLLFKMADALCGPSNALQNFQKHSSVDRTLQQDRLVGRHSPSQVSLLHQIYSYEV